MAEPFETQAEEVIALRQWWQDNRMFTVSVVVALLAGSGGWSFWQSWETEQSTAASEAWSSLLEDVNKAGENTIDSTERDALKQQATEVTGIVNGGLYADYAKLLLARFALEEDNLQAAREYLEDLQGGLWVWPWASLERQVVQSTATLLLARIDMVEGHHNQALERLDALDTDSVEVADLRGDILFAQNRKEAAAEAWQSIIASEDSQVLANLARLKLMQVQSRPSFLTKQDEQSEVSE